MDENQMAMASSRISNTTTLQSKSRGGAHFGWYSNYTLSLEGEWNYTLSWKEEWKGISDMEKAYLRQDIFSLISAW